jgi:hypothetical protein
MSRRKEIESFYKLFYNEYRMPDKLSYIMDVMRSCKNQDQLDTTLKWGKKVLGQFNDIICKSIGDLSIKLKLLNRTEQLIDTLKNYHKVLSKRFPKCQK